MDQESHCSRSQRPVGRYWAITDSSGAGRGQFRVGVVSFGTFVEVTGDLSAPFDVGFRLKGWLDFVTDRTHVLPAPIFEPTTLREVDSVTDLTVEFDPISVVFGVGNRYGVDQRARIWV